MRILTPAPPHIRDNRSSSGNLPVTRRPCRAFREMGRMRQITESSSHTISHQKIDTLERRAPPSAIPATNHRPAARTLATPAETNALRHTCVVTLTKTCTLRRMHVTMPAKTSALWHVELVTSARFVPYRVLLTGYSASCVPQVMHLCHYA